MKLSVIIPVYNEKGTVREILERVEAVDLEKEIIIVDDGSTDGTREILRTLEKPSLKVIFHPENRGKGWAIRTGLEAVEGDIVAIQDADLEYNPSEFVELIKPIVAGKAGVVYGSRFNVARRGIRSSFWFLWGGRFLTLLSNLLYRTNITDEPTCYKVFDAELLKSLDLKCKRFEFCPEVTAKVAKRGYKIYEIPISYNPRRPGEGKKVKPHDGLTAIWTLIKYRFVD